MQRRLKNFGRLIISKLFEGYTGHKMAFKNLNERFGIDMQLKYQYKELAEMPKRDIGRVMKMR